MSGMLKSSLFMQRSLVYDSGHLLVQVPKKKWYSVEENSPQGILGPYRGKDAGGIR